MENSIALEVSSKHKLNDTWILWAHLPHDTNWGKTSYKKIKELVTLEEIFTLYENLPENMIKNCMLFLMRKGVLPMWEDKNNREGGCFSYKVSNKQAVISWKTLSYVLVGETLSNTKKATINGITISPKKNFCIIKVWLKDCVHQNPEIITSVPGFTNYGCIFKKHNPEY